MACFLLLSAPIRADYFIANVQLFLPPVFPSGGGYGSILPRVKEATNLFVNLLAQYLSGLSRALFPTTFLETAVSLTIISFTGTYEPRIDLLPTSVASVGRASQRHRDVTGSNPVEVLNFFQASVRNSINCVHCDDHFFIFIYDHNVVQEKHNFRSPQTVCKELAHAKT